MNLRSLNPFLVLLFLLVSLDTLAQSPYQLDTKREVSLYCVALGSLAFGQLTNSTLTPLSPNAINTLNPNDIHPFDRATIQNNSKWAADVSDVGVYSIMALPLALFTQKEVRNDWKTILFMYGETLGLGSTLPNWTKNTVGRLRPYVYNNDVSVTQKMELDAQRSFFSSHTCVAFSSAVFLSQVYADYNPHSKWKPLIWTGSLLAASAVGYMRYQSGNHFPSDILIGAAVGSGIGFLVPHLHKIRKNSNLTVLPVSSPKLLGLHITYKL
jgi:hypothetical protein